MKISGNIPEMLQVGEELTHVDAMASSTLAFQKTDATVKCINGPRE